MEKKVIKPKKTQYNSLQTRLTKKVNPLFHSEKAIDIYNQLISGRNHYLKLDRLEETSYDPRWLDQIEDCIPDLDLIIKNPKKVIENVSDVVPIELARKTNSDSVKHLATHSQFVKEVDENGEVIPNKILNIRSDDFYQTYENRFIATLIRRLILFVEKRYNIIQTNVQVQQTELLLIKNKSEIDGKKVEIETKVKVISDVEISEEEKTFNINFIKRIEEVRKYLLFFYNSEFMKMMKTEKNVRNPILLTNILRKNRVYNHAYRLYKFIEKFDNLGIDFKVDDKYEVLKPEQLEELNNALMTSFLALRGHETIAKEKQKLKIYKPKILTSIDDESFVYGDYISAPIEFVRVDQAHKDYLNSLISKDIPAHPTKEEKEYYEDEIQQAKEIKQELKNTEHLIKQKEKQAIKDNKYFEKVVDERNREEELERIRLQKEEEKRRLDEIEAARRALIGLPEEYLDETTKQQLGIDNVEETEETPQEVDINEEIPEVEFVEEEEFEQAVSPFDIIKEETGQNVFRSIKRTPINIDDDKQKETAIIETTNINKNEQDIDNDVIVEVEETDNAEEIDPIYTIDYFEKAISPFDIMKEETGNNALFAKQKKNKTINKIPNDMQVTSIDEETATNIEQSIGQEIEIIDEEEGAISPFDIMKEETGKDDLFKRNKKK